MTQSMFSGMTSYEDQSLSHIQKDINKWQAHTNQIQDYFKKTINALEEMEYMTKMDYDVSSLFYNTIRITETFLEDLNSINTNISNGSITEKDVKLLKSIGGISAKNNKYYPQNFKKGNWHEYHKNDPNSDFRLAEKLYSEGRDFFATLIDAGNAAERLKDYITPPSSSNGPTFNINGTGHNIQQSISGDMTMHIQQSNPENIEKIKSLLGQILENIDDYFNDDETKNEIKQYIEVLQHEIEKEKPKKSMIKTALEGLQVFNQSTKFISTVIEISQKIGYLQV